MAGEFVDSGSTTSGGSTTDDSTDDSTDDGSTDSTSSSSSSDGGFSLGATLSTFASDPQRFIFGALLTGAVEWIFGGVSLVIDTILLILGGSDPTTFNAEGETLGIADVPVAIADSLGGVGDVVGSSLIMTIQSFNEPIFESAAFAGPATPLVVTIVVVLEAAVVLWVAQRIVFIVADLLQLGGLTE